MKRIMVHLLWIFLVTAATAGSQQQAQNEKLTLARATMCEAVEDGKPVNETVVFSFDKEKAVCFTFFDPVPEKTYIYHRWYRRDHLSTKIRLRVNPPRWSTVSRIQFRDGDKGPWRVDITDENGNIFKTLRFSITE